MALSPTGLSAAMNPLRSKALFDEKSAGMGYEQWKTSTPSDAKMPSIAPSQVDDSVANRVASLTSQDSPLMQAAKTEGLKAANRRGLLNSSLAIGASQDAMVRSALPIASQDASQDFQRNQAVRQFEFGTDAQGRDIDFRLGLFDKDADLQKEMQGAQFKQQTGQAALDRALQEKLEKWNLDNAERNAAAQFLTNMEQMYVSQYQSILANPNLDASTRTQFMQSIKNLRDTQINFVEQMYQVDLRW